MHVTLNHLAAFEPKTEDQATNAGRFHVALYLLKQIHAVVFPSVMVAANPEPPSDETVEEVSEVHARMTSAYRGER
jgi:hypothetical protein